MGSARLHRGKFGAQLSELVGYKAGLALDAAQLASHVHEDYRTYIAGPPDVYVRIRSEEAEEIVAQLLYGVGLTPVPYMVEPTQEVLRHIIKAPGGRALHLQFMQILVAEFERQEEAGTPLNVGRLIARCGEELGKPGLEMVRRFLEAMEVRTLQGLWNGIRRVEWKDVADLDDLFESESLEVTHGQFIDQRFVDYLERNFDQVDRMNWRKFEALTCEFFTREGYHVEIAEGRNDGGVDARIWPNKESRSNPPTTLVQCKRQKDKIEKVIVKALWADVIHESADSGLIVTTSALSPGSAKVCEARAYPVKEANRDTIRKWLSVMRTPHAGVFLGE